MIKGNTFKINVGTIAWYNKELNKLLSEMIKETKKELIPEYENLDYQVKFAQDDTISSQTRIILDKLREKYVDLFNTKGKHIALLLLKKILNQTKLIFNSSIKKMLGDKSKDFVIKGKTLSPAMKEIIKACIAENVNLIKNLPEHFYTQITGSVMRSITSGKGTKELKDELLKYSEMTERRAKNIVSDQTHKAYNNIQLRRLNDAGFEYVEWVHTGTTKYPRDYHKTDYKNGGLNHLVFKINEPPIIDKNTGQRGYPGELPFCKCTLRPVFKFDD